jgi:hypothetical protein
MSPRSQPPRADRSRRRAASLIGGALATWSLGLATAQAPGGTAGPAAPAVPAVPSGPVVLTVRGRVSRPNAGDRADFDMAMLAALPQREFSTRTPWFNEARRFTGPLLRDVLAAAGAQGRTALLIALNDYRVEMPLEDAERYDVLVARLLDGRPMAVRDKGPLFVIYPFDARAELRSAAYHARSAWQLRTIDVR